MDVLIFANSNDPVKERFFHEISKLPMLSPTFVLEHERFKTLLRNTAIAWRVIVFFAHEQSDLTLALSLKDHLSDTRVIMVLSDWNEESVKKGLALSPSLIANAKGDFSDVVAVLEKIATIAQ
jgi:hypothetical protein